MVALLGVSCGSAEDEPAPPEVKQVVQPNTARPEAGEEPTASEVAVEWTQTFQGATKTTNTALTATVTNTTDGNVSARLFLHAAGLDAKARERISAPSI